RRSCRNPRWPPPHAGTDSRASACRVPEDGPAPRERRMDNDSATDMFVPEAMDAGAVGEPWAFLADGGTETIVDCFEQTSNAVPRAIAVRQGTEIMSYAALAARANAVAHAILGHTGGKPRVVGVLGPSSPTVLAAFLGIWKAGCAYMPLDSDSPT